MCTRPNLAAMSVADSLSSTCAPWTLLNSYRPDRHDQYLRSGSTAAVQPVRYWPRALAGAQRNGAGHFLSCRAHVFFSQLCLSTFLLRGKKVKLQQSWFPRKNQLKSREKKTLLYNYCSRPVDPPKTTTTGRKLLKPAWNQARSLSPIQVTVSSTVRTRRSKILSFLSFKSSQQIKTTIESKHCLSFFEIFFLESLHQATTEFVEGPIV